MFVEKEKRAGINLSIRRLQDFEGQFAHTFSFDRRVNEEYIIPTDSGDKFVSIEGLYPCAVVPEYDCMMVLTAVYKKPIIYLAAKPEEILFKESFRGFEQTVVKRHIVPRKGKMYYSESEWTSDSSPEGLYPTLIFPRELVGKVVTLISPR